MCIDIANSLKYIANSSILVIFVMFNIDRMNQKLRFLTYLIYLLSFQAFLSAQPVEYSTRQPDFEVNSFAQDNDGYVWLATSRGLARFNGSSYMTWHATDVEGGMPNDNVMSLLYDSKGKLWIGTECGLGYMTDGKYSHTGEAVYNPISSIKELDEDHILALGKDGLVKFRKDDLRAEAVHYSIGTSWLEHVLVTDRGHVWFASSQNDSTYLYILDNDLEVINKTYMDTGLEVAGICEHPSGDVYLATAKQVTYLDVETGKVNKVYALNQLLEKGGKIHFMLPYRGNQLLVGIAGKGFYAYVPSDGSVRHIIHQQTLSAEDYVCFVDKDDRIWLSDKKNPVRTYNPKGVYIHFNPQGEDKSKDVSHLYFDKEGWLWINLEGKICSMDPETGQIRWTLDGQAFCRVSYVDSAGRLWAVLGHNDIRCYDLKDGIAHLAMRYRVEDGVFSISEGKGGRIWLSSVRKLFHIDGNGHISTVVPSGVPPFSMLLSDPRTHRVFMFTVNDGIYELHDDFSVTRVETGAIKGICYVMTSRDGTMWLGTYNEGVIRLNEETGLIERIGKDKGLTELSVKSIVEDSEGNIWFSTRSDIIRYDVRTKELSTVHDDWFHDGNSYALVSATSDDNGIVYFGGSAGITRIDTSIPFPEPKEKILNLEQITVSGKPASLSEPLVLNHDDGMLGFRFAGLDYDSGPYLKYSYMLEGRDKNWTYVYGEGSAVYTYLPAGDYVFSARVCGSDGIWSHDEIELPFKVKRDSKNTGVLGLIILVLFLMSGITLFLWRRSHPSSVQVQNSQIEEKGDESAEDSDFSEGEKEFMTKMMNILEENLESDKYTVNDLALSMGMSYSSLYAKVKSLTGETPQHFMATYRMRKAEAFLKSGKFSVSEVAYKVGSSSPMTFSREFKKHFGFPPSTLLKDKSAEKGADQNL